MNIALTIGYLLIGGSAFKMFQILNQSVIINKEQFQKVEQRIRADERKKVLEECQSVKQ